MQSVRPELTAYSRRLLAGLHWRTVRGSWWCQPHPYSLLSENSQRGAECEATVRDAPDVVLPPNSDVGVLFDLSDPLAPALGDRLNHLWSLTVASPHMLSDERVPFAASPRLRMRWPRDCENDALALETMVALEGVQVCADSSVVWERGRRELRDD